MGLCIVIIVLAEHGVRQRVIPSDESTEATVERDAWLLEAVYFFAFGSWEIPEDIPPEPELTAIGSTLITVRQLALDGKLTIWGKPFENEPWQKISPEYWKDFNLDILEALRGNPEYFGTQLATIGFANSADMVALMTCRAQVVKVSQEVQGHLN